MPLFLISASLLEMSVALDKPCAGMQQDVAHAPHDAISGSRCTFPRVAVCRTSLPASQPPGHCTCEAPPLSALHPPPRVPTGSLHAAHIRKMSSASFVMLKQWYHSTSGIQSR